MSTTKDTPQRPATSVPTAPRRGALRGPALVGVAAAAVVGVIAAVDPNQSGHYPTCPFLALTGYYCPGCGSLRAIHDLAHGNLAGALSRNPFTVLALVGLAIGWVFWARRLWRGQPRTRVAPAAVLYGLLTLVLVFWALRNVPGWTWLSPA